MSKQELFGRKEGDELVFWDSNDYDKKGRVHIRLVYVDEHYLLTLTHLFRDVSITTRWKKVGHPSSPAMGIDMEDVECGNYFVGHLLDVIDPE